MASSEAERIVEMTDAFVLIMAWPFLLVTALAEHAANHALIRYDVDSLILAIALQLAWLLWICYKACSEFGRVMEKGKK